MVYGTMHYMKTSWDFSKLYTGFKDTKIEKEMKAEENAFKTFALKYSDRKFVNSAKTLKKALDDWNSLQEKTTARHIWYLHLLQSVDTGNTELQSVFTKYYSRYVEAAKLILFFNISISKIDARKQVLYLKDKSLSAYWYFLKVNFNEGKYVLSESEEKIMADKYQVAHVAWTDMMSKYENAQFVKHGKKKIPLGEALSIKNDLPRVERRSLHKEVMAAYKNMGFLAEAEINAVIRNKMIDDSTRGYKTPYESVVLRNQNDVKSIENLIDVVTKSNHLSKRFYTLKTKLINQREKTSDIRITMAEVGSGLSTAKNATKKIPYEKAVEIITQSFGEAGQEFADLFQSYVEEGRIDVYPQLGKRTGAFCSPNVNSPTMVLLNYAGKLNDVATLAHEMGHAIHSDYSKKQLPIYQGYTMSVAEVASTFFEHILTDALLEQATPEEKRDLLVTKVQDRVSTIFAQVAYFQFEKKLHAAVKEKGFVGKEEIAALFAECRRSYLGDAVEVTEDDGYAYVYIEHFRLFFYVYSYAYGQLIADALYAEYKKDKRFIEKVKIFLSAGGSMSPEEIFASIGIDTAKPDFFKKGLQMFEKDLEAIEKMIG